jgi:hypothetical protein
MILEAIQKMNFIVIPNEERNLVLIIEVKKQDFSPPSADRNENDQVFLRLLLKKITIRLFEIKNIVTPCHFSLMLIFFLYFH